MTQTSQHSYAVLPDPSLPVHKKCGSAWRWTLQQKFRLIAGLQIRMHTRKLFVFISQPKHMLWVLKRTVLMRRFICAPKHMFKLMGMKIITILRFKKNCLTGPMLIASQNRCIYTFIEWIYANVINTKTSCAGPYILLISWADPERGTGGFGPSPLKNHQNIGFLSKKAILVWIPWKISKLPSQHLI